NPALLGTSSHRNWEVGLHHRQSVLFCGMGNKSPAIQTGKFHRSVPSAGFSAYATVWLNDQRGNQRTFLSSHRATLFALLLWPAGRTRQNIFHLLCYVVFLMRH